MVDGLTRIRPNAVPEPLPLGGAWQAAPTNSAAQLQFVHDHKLSSKTLRYTWTTPTGRFMFMLLRVFKRSAAAARVLLGNIPAYLRELDAAAPKAGDIIVDVGASVGTVAVAVALNWPGVRVVAIEPSPDNFRYLLWNIKLNRLDDRILPLNVAVARHRGLTWLGLHYSTVAPGGVGRDGLSPGSKERDNVYEYVAPAMTLAAIADLLHLPRIHWLKINCGGCEWHLAKSRGFERFVGTTVYIATAVLHPMEIEAGDSSSMMVVSGLCSDGPGRRAFLSDLAMPWPEQPAMATEMCTTFPGETAAKVASASPFASARTALHTPGPIVGSPVGAVVWTGTHEAEGSSDAFQQVDKTADADMALLAERRIFLFSSISHDDEVQWPIIPHFVRHYRDLLRVQPDRFLIVLHSGSGNVTGLSGLARRLNERYGIMHTYPITGVYSGELIFQHKLRVLNEHVSNDDWVVEADGDEFVVLPRGWSAPEAAAILDAQGANVLYGLMVDRVAKGGNLEQPPREYGSIFAQYPLTCGVTWFFQRSDVRKANLYRGNLRAVAGTHSVLGLNTSALSLTRGPRAKAHQVQRLLAAIRNYVAESGGGEENYKLLPYAQDGGKLPEIRPSILIATVYHFKWVKGVTKKLWRRTLRDGRLGEFARGIYEYFFAIITAGVLDTDRYCNNHNLPGPRDVVRGLTHRELALLFLNWKPDMLNAYIIFSGDTFLEEDVIVAPLLHTLIYGIDRRLDIPGE
eukprot:TRINITY_DN43136_c0_g1_i1.p1 TRINITY_DN43136_c0_g1~~TRINITY_DN43136_c0_g1_i1.p1  ORF type:complete len:869 (-),score=52.97 TRINITY_DN43136_c0_g1_i1:46-2271(-)